MANPIVNLCPNDMGMCADEDAGNALAYRRLSIFDIPPAGYLSILSESELFAIVFNGGILNQL